MPLLKAGPESQNKIFLSALLPTISIGWAARQKMLPSGFPTFDSDRPFDAIFLEGNGHAYSPSNQSTNPVVSEPPELERLEAIEDTNHAAVLHGPV